jgi:hypothetical protein
MAGSAQDRGIHATQAKLIRKMKLLEYTAAWPHPDQSYPVTSP